MSGHSVITYGKSEVRPWRVSHLQDLLDFSQKFGSPDSIRMNARDYADIRKFGRDEIEVENDPALWRTGRQATYKGVPIMVSRDVPEGRITVVDGSGKVLSQRRSFDLSITHCYSEADCECNDCVALEVMST